MGLSSASPKLAPNADDFTLRSFFRGEVDEREREKKTLLDQILLQESQPASQPAMHSAIEPAGCGFRSVMGAGGVGVASVRFSSRK